MFSKDQWMGIIRHALTFLGAYLVATGITSEAMTSEVIGGVMTLVGFIWSVFSKPKTQ